MAKLVYSAIASADGYRHRRGGKRALPDGVRADLELQDTRRFASGVVYLSYRLPRGG